MEPAFASHGPLRASAVFSVQGGNRTASPQGKLFPSSQIVERLKARLGHRSLGNLLTSHRSLGRVVSEPCWQLSLLISSHLILPSTRPVPCGTLRLREVKCSWRSQSQWETTARLERRTDWQVWDCFSPQTACSSYLEFSCT